MKELVEYRSELTKRLLETANEFRAACLKVKDPHAPLSDGWSVHQIAVHTRDVDRLVYGSRARRTAIEDNPEFSNFDGNTYLAENYDASESLTSVTNDLIKSTQALVELLQSLPTEAWSRLSRHAVLGGGLTLQSWVEKNLAHIEEHLETVKKQATQ
ncbi:MAG TPA: DinB family protein [Anaerolineales bacterium]|nr:DinB family protein [Anaerolineales bacterium]